MRIRKIYETYGDLSNLPTALAKLPWSFNCLLIDKVTEINKRIWYAEECLENGWSFIVLDHQIDLKLYERQADNSLKYTNYDEKLLSIQGELAVDVNASAVFLYVIIQIIKDRGKKYAGTNQKKKSLPQL